MQEKSEKKKKFRRSLTLGTKGTIIRMRDEGIPNNEIVRRLGLPRSTISTVFQNKQKILSELENSTPVSTKIIRKRDNIIADVEKLLLVWIDQQADQSVHLTHPVIKERALSIFAEIKASRGESAKNFEFAASRGWFDRFRRRSNLDKIENTDEEAVNIDIKVSGNFPAELAKIIEDGGYSKSQVFNVDETGLYWKRMFTPKLSAIAGIQSVKDRLSLLFGCNASGDFRLKPMLVYHTESPDALKNYSKSTLPVYWKSNAKAWITASVFEEWFSNYFVPAVKEYCMVKSIPFHILLLLDNASGHPRSLDDLHPNVRVVMLPEYTTSLLQPMEQGVIAIFKSYYLSKLFIKALAAIDNKSDESKSKGNLLKQFWDDFTILDGIKTIRDAWMEIPESTLKGIWKNLCPQFIFEDFVRFENHVEEIIKNIVEMAKQLGLQVEPEDVNEVLWSHSKPMAAKDLLHFGECVVQDEDTKFEEEISTSIPKELKMEELAAAFRLLEEAMSMFEKADPNFERSSKVNAGILEQYACYREIFKLKEKQLLDQPSTSTDCDFARMETIVKKCVDELEFMRS